ncbi:7-deoxyloganetic acid glucosyltransferase-like [Dorcoceras hygrometricum]|uniref:7-deoxyloganetic acid glucosyltransferase-like n=1 Tax=Dorcoceras hygrometricum TaxID=472368 RepID=A0A2Z7C3N6_9LAMI|nr:7-deoxyloganetic acid glucosyltransferase-like [Dorcoceras hygrometricum]
MAASFIQNALQVNFDSVLTFPDESMVKIFKALESTGLRGFLVCPSVLYKDDLVAFFAHSLVKENEVISCVQRKFVGISEDQFAEKAHKAAPTENNLAILPMVQYSEPISVVPAASPSARRCNAPKRKLVLQESDEEETVEKPTDKERTAVEQPTVEESFEEIVAKVIRETAEIEMVEIDLEEPVVLKTAGMEPVETERRIDVSAISNDDAVLSSMVLSNEEGPLVEKENEKVKEKETEKDTTDKGKCDTQTHGNQQSGENG